MKMINAEINWNIVRKQIDKTLEVYASIINIEEIEELRSLGNDIISVFRDNYFGDQD